MKIVCSLLVAVLGTYFEHKAPGQQFIFPCFVKWSMTSVWIKSWVIPVVPIGWLVTIDRQEYSFWQTARPFIWMCFYISIKLNEIMQHLRMATTPEPTIETPWTTGNVAKQCLVGCVCIYLPDEGNCYWIYSGGTIMGPTSQVPFTYCLIICLDNIWWNWNQTDWNNKTFHLWMFLHFQWFIETPYVIKTLGCEKWTLVNDEAQVVATFTSC